MKAKLVYVNEVIWITSTGKPIPDAFRVERVRKSSPDTVSTGTLGHMTFRRRVISGGSNYRGRHVVDGQGDDGPRH